MELDADNIPDLEDVFNAAADFVAGAVTSGSQLFDNQSKLGLYGLYKQATVGKCSTSKPAFWDLQGRAKWDAWNKLGDMSRDTAMQQYIAIVTKLAPDFQASDDLEGEDEPKRQKGAGLGPVFSAFAEAEGADEEGQEDDGTPTLHELSGQGNVEALQALLAAGTPVDSRDAQGCTALHFAADRGSVAAAEALLAAGADINARDADGQAPLHYAAMCEQEQVARLLVDARADTGIVDNDGSTAKDMAPQQWTWWQ